MLHICMTYSTMSGIFGYQKKIAILYKEMPYKDLLDILNSFTC